MDLVVLAGDRDNAIAQKIALQLQVKLVVPHVRYFTDGELHVSLSDPSYFIDKIVFLVQSTSIPVNENLLRVLFLAHELKNAGAKKNRAKQKAMPRFQIIYQVQKRCLQYVHGKPYNN